MNHYAIIIELLSTEVYPIHPFVCKARHVSLRIGDSLPALTIHSLCSIFHYLVLKIGLL